VHPCASTDLSELSPASKLKKLAAELKMSPQDLLAVAAEAAEGSAGSKPAAEEPGAAPAEAAAGPDQQFSLDQRVQLLTDTGICFATAKVISAKAKAVFGEKPLGNENVAVTDIKMEVGVEAAVEAAKLQKVWFEWRAQDQLKSKSLWDLWKRRKLDAGLKLPVENVRAIATSSKST